MRLGEGDVEAEGDVVMQAAGVEGLRRIAVEADAAILDPVPAPIIADNGGITITLGTVFAHEVLPIEDCIGGIDKRVGAVGLVFIVERQTVALDTIGLIVIAGAEIARRALLAAPVGIRVLVEMFSRDAEGDRHRCIGGS